MTAKRVKKVKVRIFRPPNPRALVKHLSHRPMTPQEP
jgi:hypothetical protein